MATPAFFDKLYNDEKRRYIAEHAPDVLCALIARRPSTEPHMLIEPAIETVAQLFDKLTPSYVRPNGNGATEFHPDSAAQAA